MAFMANYKPWTPSFFGSTAIPLVSNGKFCREVIEGSDMWDGQTVAKQTYNQPDQLIFLYMDVPG